LTSPAFQLSSNTLAAAVNAGYESMNPLQALES